MAVVTTVPEPNLWDEICREVAASRPPYHDDSASVATVYEDYDAAKHTPVFYGNVMHKRVLTDEAPEADFDPTTSHPACVGFAFVSRPPTQRVESTPTVPDSRTCTPREYLEHFVFPLLLPALEQMLHEAKTHRCFERKYTDFNAADFLTEYLYKNNPRRTDRENMTLADIPFVQEWWLDHPRPPLPKSVLWSEEEASLVIQAFWHGYKVRAEPEIQELRAWQHEWREENRSKSLVLLSDVRTSVEDQPTSPLPDTQQEDIEAPHGDDTEDRDNDVIVQSENTRLETGVCC